MEIKFNDFQKNYLVYRQEFDQAINNVLNSGWYILGNQVSDFETNWANYLGSKYTVGVANGLEALQIALMALNIGIGDEVVTTPNSAVATALAIKAVGAKPVFVDIDQYGHLDANLVESVITSKTKAIIPKAHKIPLRILSLSLFFILTF